MTSAETVLLQHQSIDEFKTKLDDPSITVVVSLSPQSITSLAALYNIPPAHCVAALTAALKSRGVAAVFDINWARDVSLLEAASEFIRRYRQRQSTQPSALPLLASACPGWICYAEKTHGTFILPYISTTKSPQAVLGTVVKRQWAPHVASITGPLAIYHCAVMPCYDKKLEASRDDFLLDGSVPETDCVLATTELHEWLQEQGVLPLVPLSFDGNANGNKTSQAAMDGPFTNQVPGGHGESYGAGGGGSGGYMDYVFRAAAKVLFQRDLPQGPLPTVQGRNADIRELSLEIDGTRVLHFAAAYGFRNIQGLMRKIKTGRCEYDYVEVMACPSGCLNGGGQVKPGEMGLSPQQLIEALENAYAGNGVVVPRPPEQNASVVAMYRDWVRGEPGGDQARALFHTQYHQREKTVASALADW